MSNDTERAGETGHRIVAKRRMSGGTRNYTCACGETIEAHPTLLDEAFAFHLAQASTPPGAIA